MSDTHMLHRSLAVPAGDALIHCGDFSNEPILSEYDDFFAWFASWPHKHKILVAGNHDELLQQFPAIRKRIPSTINYLEDSTTEVEGLKIFGSPWTPGASYMAYTYREGKPGAPAWSMIPPFTDVVITHGPPRGILDVSYTGLHIGDKDLLARIVAIRPRAHLFGHVHGYNGVVERDGTIYVNAAIGDDEEEADEELSSRIRVVDL